LSAHSFPSRRQCTHRRLERALCPAVADPAQSRNGLKLARVDEELVVDDIVSYVEELDATKNYGSRTIPSVVVEVVVMLWATSGNQGLSAKRQTKRLTEYALHRKRGLADAR
jgi:hypothetical protein